MAIGTSRGAPTGSPGGRPTSKSPRTSMACWPSSVWTVTGRPSASTRYSSQWWGTLVWSQGTSSLRAMALGPMTAPVMLHPPPSTKSLPSATWAASHKSMVTRTAVKLPGAPDTSSPVPPDVGSQPMTTPTDGLALPSTERPEPVTPRKRRRGWSLRAHLIAVVIVTIALVVLSGVLVISKDYRRARDEGARNANFQAKLAAADLSTSILDLREIIVRRGPLLGQATGGNLAAITPGGCPFNLAFDSYHNFTSGLLDVVLPDGSVLCSSDKAQVP